MLEKLFPAKGEQSHRSDKVTDGSAALRSDKVTDDQV